MVVAFLPLFFDPSTDRVDWGQVEGVLSLCRPVLGHFASTGEIHFGGFSNLI